MDVSLLLPSILPGLTEVVRALTDGATPQRFVSENEQHFSSIVPWPTQKESRLQHPPAQHSPAPQHLELSSGWHLLLRVVNVGVEQATYFSLGTF